jgi:hypothetical protein
MGASMRSLVIAIASFGLFAVAVQAADDTSPVAGSLPPNTRSQQLYLFMLKKNGLSIRMSPDKFCGDLGYGEAVKWSDDAKKDSDGPKGSDDYKKDSDYNKKSTDDTKKGPDEAKGFWELGNDEYGKDGKKISELIWVICQFPKVEGKPKPKTEPKTETK